MRAKDCETMDDVIKHIMWRGNKQGLHLLEIEQIQNMLLITYGKIVEDEVNKKMEGMSLVLSTKVKKDKEIPMSYRRVKLDLCNFIEPRKSRKQEYKRMREIATKMEQVE